MDEYVQYIVVRKDLVVQMGYGKLAAQVSHGSLGVLLERKVYEEADDWGHFPAIKKEKTQLIEDEAVQKWFNGPFVKLVVYVKGKEQLLNLKAKLDELNIKNKLIYDACRTKLESEEENGSTLTCMGVVPINRDDVPKCLQKLQLLD